ncbi:MAG: sulfatase-like hydrolase/transferase [Ruminococcus sp.]|nr:sulfatase-like hydrolase/transferase [Ruminococcus sp.]
MSDTNKVQSEAKAKKTLSPKQTKILTSLLAGCGLPLATILLPTLTAYSKMAKELYMGLWEFFPVVIVMFVLVSAILTAVLLFTKSTVRNTIFSLSAGITVAAFLQNALTSASFEGFPADGGWVSDAVWKLILNFSMWVTIIAASVWFGILWNKSNAGRKMLALMMSVALIFQCVAVIPGMVSAVNETASAAAASTQKSFLTTENMFEVSKKDNIIVFVVDRFDTKYYDAQVAKDPDAFKDFDGFTYYSDYIAKFPRTYPAISSMLSGVYSDFSMSKGAYFNKVYSQSPFLKDLEKNNYKINVYIPEMYAYDNADSFDGRVANASSNSKFSIGDRFIIALGMIERGAYFWLPDMLKSQKVSLAAMNEGVMALKNLTKYELDDVKVYQEFCESGLYTQSRQNNFTFLHLRGCHSPFTMDEECNPVEENSVGSYEQTKGTLKFIREYLQQMKDKGLYEDATVVILGDHAALRSDKKLYVEPELTAFMIKESGKAGTPFAESDVPVSQDNYLASIVKSAGLQVDRGYGTAVSDVKADSSSTRTHYFQTWNADPDVNYTYEIKGSGKDFANWKIVEEEVIGKLYK